MRTTFAVAVFFGIHIQCAGVRKNFRNIQGPPHYRYLRPLPFHVYIALQPIAFLIAHVRSQQKFEWVANFNNPKPPFVINKFPEKTVDEHIYEHWDDCLALRHTGPDSSGNRFGTRF